MPSGEPPEGGYAVLMWGGNNVAIIALLGGHGAGRLRSHMQGCIALLCLFVEEAAMPVCKVVSAAELVVTGEYRSRIFCLC